MKILQDSLRLILVLVLAVVAMYLFRNLTKDQRQTEGFDNYCEAAFTAEGTEIKLRSFVNGEDLGVDKHKVNDNLLLGNKGEKWDLQRIIVEDSVGLYPETKKPDSCAVMMKTTSNPSFFLSADMGGVTNSVGATPIGGAKNQVWYVIRLRPKKPTDELFQSASRYIIKEKGDWKLLESLYLVTTSPRDFTNDPSSPPARYLTARSASRSVVDGDLYLEDMPSLSSLWIVKYEKKGEVKIPAFQPAVGIGAYPNQENVDRGRKGPYPADYGAFMPSFLRIWNRTFWSPGLLDRIKDQSYMFQISVNLDPPNYKDQEPFARGTATVKLIDGLRLNIKEPLKNLDISHQIGHNVLPSNPTFDIMTIGDDMVVGHKDNSTLILQLLPKGMERIGVPLIKGWMISSNDEDKKGTITPLCALPQKGVIQNLMGVCQSLLPDMDIDRFMLTHGLSPMDYKKNYNISKRLVETSKTDRPKKPRRGPWYWRNYWRNFWRRHWYHREFFDNSLENDLLA